MTNLSYHSSDLSLIALETMRLLVLMVAKKHFSLYSTTFMRKSHNVEIVGALII